ncbi:SAP domain-containing ribonucleoprotein-like isoform X2 [Cricetulus griseus]|uniref:SAP domain-containing ribonucleoprotein n=1 Tax=Cricetulus griseus TaxID=10029 RepID=A0A9J7JTV5_CRIGR|nr:SAP domain-containing ribonucleoprotein-like isoform X2 [Cricetulus griseus]
MTILIHDTNNIHLYRESPSANDPGDTPVIVRLAELKQECLARGLETKGIKQNLINRLQAHLEEHAEEEVNEGDFLGDETKEEEQDPIELPVKEEEPPEKAVDVASEKKVVKIPSGIPQTESTQKGAEPFNVPVSLESKKAARAARFGISSVPTKGLSSDTKPTAEDDEKLKKRKYRFGIVRSSAGSGTTEDTEAKKRKRAERLGIA